MTSQYVALASSLLFHVHHGVEPDIVEYESFKGMFSARLASKNCSPNSVLSKDLVVATKKHRPDRTKLAKSVGHTASSKQCHFGDLSVSR